MSEHILEESPKNRYEDIHPNRRSDGCLFKCDDHGEWKERLKTLDHIPEVLAWMNSVKGTLVGLPDVIHWMDQEKGSRSTSRIIIGTLVAVFLTGFISSALMFKSDITTNLNAFKVESVERINLFKTEISERQAALKLEISERQRVYEENAKDQNTADTARINSIVDAVAEMKTQTGIMFRLSEQAQKQAAIDRDESKAMIKDLRTMVIDNQSESRTKRK